jgi:hypothetical protein
MQGQWIGTWGGDWLGGVSASGNPIVIAAMHATGLGSALLLAQALNVSQPPVNGPSGGPNWLAGYSPNFGQKPATKRRNKRDELLFLTA